MGGKDKGKQRENGREEKRVPRKGKRAGGGRQEKHLLLHPLPVPRTSQVCMRTLCSSASLLCLPSLRTVLFITLYPSDFLLLPFVVLLPNTPSISFLVSTSNNLL